MVNDNKSTPAAVSVGATPAGQRVFVNHEFVTDPPLVYSITNVCTFPDVVVPVTVHVTVPVPVAETMNTFAFVKFKLTVVPAVAVIDPDVSIVNVFIFVPFKSVDPVTTKPALPDISNDPVITADPLYGNPAPVPPPPPVPTDAVVNISFVPVFKTNILFGDVVSIKFVNCALDAVSPLPDTVSDPVMSADPLYGNPEIDSVVKILPVVVLITSNLFG